MRGGILKNWAFLDFELLMFQLVDLQRIAVMLVVEIAAGYPAVGH